MKLLITIFICFLSLSTFGQDIVLKEMSFTELFQAIETSKDSIFTLSDALIVLNDATDERFKKLDSLTPKRDTIIVNKELKLNYVHFELDGALTHIHFKKPLNITNSTCLKIESSKFDSSFSYAINYDEDNKPRQRPENLDNRFIKLSYYEFFPLLRLKDNTFNAQTYLDNNFKLYGNTQGEGIIESNIFDFRDIKRSFFNTPLIIGYISVFKNNTIYNNYHQIQFNGINIFSNNKFKGFGLIALNTFSGTSDFTEIKNNKLHYFTTFKFSEKGFYDWENLKNNFLFYENDLQFKFSELDSIELKNYAHKRLLTDEKFYTSYIINLEKLHGNYKTKRNFKSANAVFVAIKDLETDRLKYFYEQEADFDTFFQWQVNRFVGLFSDYGTKPSKAIVISIYVILIFALFYFLYPNDWDSTGKNRLINRYNFFMKYLNIDSGMHEIYQNETKKKILEYEEFRKFIETSKHTTPKFFKATALPLYKWSVLGSKFTTNFLKRVDILRGTWEEVPKKHKWWKGLLIILVFILAVFYDLLIKFLNALMLSINTFSTLGFGEIPIKGLPRYFTIIQGFIGWFMLTIFSVSLISQLLN